MRDCQCILELRIPLQPYSLFLVSPSRRRKGLRRLPAWPCGGVGDGDLGEGLLFLGECYRLGDLHRDRIRRGDLTIADRPAGGAIGRDVFRCAIGGVVRWGVVALHAHNIQRASATCTLAAPNCPGDVSHDRVERYATKVIIIAVLRARPPSPAAARPP